MGVTGLAGRVEAGGAPWRARVRGPHDAPVGAGVLVDRWHVLTCVDVVARAVGAAIGGSRPTAELMVDFPLYRQTGRSSRWRVRAAVPEYGWVPVDGRGRGGLALLLLRQPAPVEVSPAALDGVGDLARRSTQVFGEVDDSGGGAWFDLRFGDVDVPDGERILVQVEGPALAEGEPRLGGSGAVDARTGRVVGLIVADSRDGLQVHDQVGVQFVGQSGDRPGGSSRRVQLVSMGAAIRHLPHLAPLLERSVSLPTMHRPPRQPGVLLERRLNDTELHALFSRFWAVPAMPSRVARDYYLDALEKQLGGRVIVSRRPSNVLDGWAMLFALLERPGSLRLLADLLLSMHEQHPAVVQFAEFVRFAFPDLLLLQSERVALEGRLIGLGWEKVGASHRFATRRFGAPPAMAPTPSGEVIRDLEGRGALTGAMPPLLVMVDDLAHAVGGALESDLHRWIDGVAARLVVPPEDLRSLCDDAARRHAQPVTAHVVIVLTPDGMDLDRFLVSAVVVVGDEPERPVFRDDNPRTLREIEATLDDAILPLVPEAVGDAENLVIQFIVPERLFSTPFEQWVLDRHGWPRPLGVKYPVVLRSLERLRDGTTHSQWKLRTQRLHAYGRRSVEEAVLHVSRDARRHPAPPDEGAQVHARLMAAPDVVVLAVPFPPEPEADSDAVGAGLRAGLPAVIWSRTAVDPVRFRRVVDGDLLAEGPADLPRQVWKYRVRHPVPMQSSKQTDAEYPAVALVIGEATHIPQQLRGTYRFRAPGSRQKPGGSGQ